MNKCSLLALLALFPACKDDKNTDTNTDTDTSPFVWIETHTHLRGIGYGGDLSVTDWEGAATEAADAMADLGVAIALIMPPPVSPDNVDEPIFYDYTALESLGGTAEVSFSFLGGGGLLNPLIHGTPTEEVTEIIEADFVAKANAILDAGAKGFGELTILHLSASSSHPFIQSPADHRLFYALFEVAAQRDVPVDIHLEVVSEDMPTPPSFLANSDNNPEELQANLPAFKKLLGDFPEVKVVWTHVGWDNTGDMTLTLLEELLLEYPNLYLSLKVMEELGRQSDANRPVDLEGNLRQPWIDLIQLNPDRFIIGGDQFYPGLSWGSNAQSLSTTIDAYKQLPEKLQRKVAQDNAISIYGL
jgi:hypothetical protein